MRPVAPVVLLFVAACATGERRPPAARPAAAAEVPAGASLPVVEFVSAELTKRGGAVIPFTYSERPGDVSVDRVEFSKPSGVVTVSGQVGFGKGSSYAGLGITIDMLPPGDGTVSVTPYRTVTFRLSSPNGATLRVKVRGGDEKVRLKGCYPAYLVTTTPEMKEYTIPFAKFLPETWCGGQGVSIAGTLPDLFGFEIADAGIRKAPTSFSVGAITVNP
jgi:hypothetical protein